jgi:hypothetical protein
VAEKALQDRRDARCGSLCSQLSDNPECGTGVLFIKLQAHSEAEGLGCHCAYDPLRHPKVQ